MNTRVQQLRATTEHQLLARRQQLTELFAAEEAQYKLEYIQRQETPETTRQRMAQRVDGLRMERERSRKAEADSKLYQRLKDGADELRTQDSQLGALQCRIHQDLQMQEKQSQGTQEREEDQIFAELQRREKAKQDAQDELQRKQREELTQNTLGYLSWQRDAREQTRLSQAERVAREKAMLSTEWAQEERVEQAVQRERLEQTRARNEEIIQHNTTNKLAKAEEQAFERVQDKKLISQVLKREQQEEQQELLEKHRRRQEARELTSFYSMRLDQQGELEKLIEQHAKRESDEQWRNLEHKWGREEDARVRLMHQVYDSRHESVLQKKQRETQHKENELQEQQRIRHTVEQAEAEEALRREAARLGKVNHQQALLEQISAKGQQRHCEAEDELQDYKRAKLAELEYQKMIDEERRRGVALLDELRAKRPY